VLLISIPTHADETAPAGSGHAAVQTAMPCPAVTYALEFNRVFNLELSLSGLHALPEPEMTACRLSWKIESEDRVRYAEYLPAGVTLEPPSPTSLEARISVTLKDGAAPNRLPVDCADILVGEQPRTLAIAMSELVRTALNAAVAASLERQRAELHTLLSQQGSGKTEAGQRKPAKPDRTDRSFRPHGAEIRARTELRLAAGGLLMLTAEGNRLSVGGELASYTRAGNSWRWAFEGAYNPNQIQTDFGALHVGNLGLSIGADVHAERAPELHVGPRLHAAILAAQGQSILGLPEAVHYGLGVALGARGDLAVPLATYLRVRTTVELAWTLREALFTAGGRTAFSYAGLQLAWGVGMVVSL
jgi:hypothetical protein